MKLILEALRLYEAERYEEAARRLQVVTQFEPDNVQAWMYYGAALGKMGRWPAAAQALRQVVRLQPEQASAYADLALALFEHGDLDAAEHAADSALALEPDHPGALAVRQRLRPSRPPTPEPPPVPEPASPLAGPSRGARWRQGLAALAAPDRRLQVMLIVLAALVLLVGVRLARRPGQTARSLRQADALLAQADRERAALADNPGEDFDAMDRVRALLDRAELLIATGAAAHPASPEVEWLLARLTWLRHGDALGAENRIGRMFAQLESSRGRGGRLLGRSSAALGADGHRLLAEIAIATASGRDAAASLDRAQRDLDQAARLRPDPRDAALRQMLAEARQRLGVRSR